MNLYSWSFIAVTCAVVWPFARNHAATRLERLGLSLAMALLSIVASIAVSLFFSGRLRLISILPLAAVFVACLVLALRARTLKGTRALAKPKYGRIVAMIALAVAALGFGRQFQFASFWGDLGVYTMEAQHYLAGGSVTFEPTASQLNIPPESTKPSLPNGINATSSKGFQFHALPTWPSFMALFGPSYDVEAILSLLFCLSIVLFYLLACEVFDDGVPTLLATIVLALLPLAWFLSLYATAEMLVLAITLATGYLYIKTGFHSFVLAVGAFAFGVVHISFFTISPIIGVIILLAAINGNSQTRRCLALGAVGTAIGGVLAMYFATHVSEKYALDIAKSTLGSHAHLVWVALISPAIGVIPFVLGVSAPGVLENLRNAYGYCRKRDAAIGISIISLFACVIAMQVYLIGWTPHYLPIETSLYNSASARVAYMDRGLVSVAHHSIFSLMAASGLVGLAAFLLLPFAWFKGGGSVVIAEHLTWVMGAYVVLLYGLLHIDVTNNYYASRYLLPVAVPALLLLAVPWLGRWRIGSEWVVGLIGVVSLYYVSALLGQGFFLGDRRFVASVTRNVDIHSDVYVEGSTWLDYMLVPALVKTAGVPRTKGLGDPGRAQLITDAANVVGGYKSCYSYEQRRIPWQISYPLHPEFDEHNVCVVYPSVGGEMTLRGNQWVIGGEFGFIAVAAKRDVEIRINSLGWWSTKRPFASDWKAIKPSLFVCGKEFELSTLTPSTIVFRGRMSAPFCRAVLKTATFTPRAIGEGPDARALGIDMYSLRIQGI